GAGGGLHSGRGRPPPGGGDLARAGLGPAAGAGPPPGRDHPDGGQPRHPKRGRAGGQPLPPPLRGRGHLPDPLLPGGDGPALGLRPGEPEPLPAAPSGPGPPPGGRATGPPAGLGGPPGPRRRGGPSPLAGVTSVLAYPPPSPPPRSRRAAPGLSGAARIYREEVGD